MGRIAIVLSMVLALASRINCTPVTQIEEHDIREGDSLILDCPRIARATPDTNSALYWSRTPSGSQTKNVVIQTFALEKGYEVKLSDDNYQLEVKSARYERDNGLFICEGKEDKTGNTIFAKEHRVTILLPPGEPRITPIHPLAEEGRPYNLTCESSGGSPDPDITWIDNSGREIPSILIPGGNKKIPTKAVLTITPSKSDDRSQYKCIVSSRALPRDNHLNTKTTLRVSYAPKVTILDESPLRIMAGEDAVLKCVAEGNPEVRSVKWFRNGQLVSNNNEHVLKSVTEDDTQLYTCKAHNGILPDGEASLKLDVLYGPRVSVPSERDASKGDRITVNCEVRSNPEPSRVYWIRENDNFRQEGPVLNIDNADPRDTGSYLCVAEVTMIPSKMAKNNFESKVIGNATLQINVRHQPGESRILPENPIAVVNKPYTMQCTSDPMGYPHPEYRWWKEGSEHTKLSAYANYTILSVQQNHEGVYYCQPHNSLGKGTIAKVHLSVNESPIINMPLKPQSVRKTGDQSLVLGCSARGKPKPFVMWTHNGQNITASEDRFSISTMDKSEDNRAVSVTSSLTFVKPLTANERGRYACHFDNGFGDPAMSEMVLRVEHSPEVRHDYNRVAFDLNENAIIECRMQAYPEPTFEWMHRKRIIDSYKQYSTNVTDNGDDVYTGLLSIANIKEDDYGDYTCRAFNQIGNDKKTIIKLVKKSNPDAPTKVAVSEVLHDKITLVWSPGFNGGYPNTEFIVNFVDDNGREKNESCRQSYPCTITGLQSLSHYNIKVIAHNPKGFSGYSETIRVLTKLDLKEMPRPVMAQYDPTNGMVHVSMNELPYGASLEHFVIRLEARVHGTDQWKLIREGVAIDKDHAQVDVVDTATNMIDPDKITDVRVMVCLRSNLTWCGDARIAEPFNHENWISTSAANSSLSAISLFVTICVAAGLFFLLMVFLFCCCWKKHKNTQQIEKKDFNASITQNTINHNTINNSPPCYYDSMTKTGIVETVMDEPVKSNGAIAAGEQPVHNGTYGHAQPQYISEHVDPMYGTMMNTNDYYIGAKQDHYSPYDPTPGYFYADDHMSDMHYDVSGLPNPYGTSEDIMHGQYMHSQQQMNDNINCNESVDSVQTNGQRRVVREIIV